MNINGMGSMQQVQMQTRQMDGSGNGQGKGGENGMKSIMQNLDSQDRVAFQEQLSSLSQTEKASMKDQLKQVDGTNLSSNEYLQSLLSVMSSSTNTNTSSTSVSIYA